MKTKSTFLASIAMLMGLAIFVTTPMEANANGLVEERPVYDEPNPLRVIGIGGHSTGGGLVETGPVYDEMNPIRVIGIGGH